MVYQTLLEEIDPNTIEYNDLPFTLKYGWAGYVTRWLPYGNFLIPGGVGLMSSYCVPLQLVNEFGNWDPWLIQEDSLIWFRTVVGSRDTPRFEFIRSVVYNAPPLTWYDSFKQLERAWGQGVCARATFYSNMIKSGCSMHIGYLIGGIVIDMTVRWAGLYNLVFLMQQVTGYYYIDFHVWIVVIIANTISSIVSAFHQVEVHLPKSLAKLGIHIFCFFALTNPSQHLFHDLHCIYILKKLGHIGIACYIPDHRSVNQSTTSTKTIIGRMVHILV